MPQPVDLQTEVARVTAAERIQQVADRTSLAAQQHLAVEEQEERVNSETTVHQPEPKEPEVDAEARRRNPFMGRRKRGRPSDSDEDKARDEAAHRFYRADEREATAEDPDAHEFDVTV